VNPLFCLLDYHCHLFESLVSLRVEEFTYPEEELWGHLLIL
jgi:hypothetical protein